MCRTRSRSAAPSTYPTGRRCRSPIGRSGDPTPGW
jgi:hypothetical protein